MPSAPSTLPPPTHPVDHLLLAADLIGTFTFGLEGALAAVHGHLDLIGIFVLAFSTALGGGLVRDVLIGAIPPASLRDWRYPATAFTAGLLIFFLHADIETHVSANFIIWLDAAGLALFAVAGTQKALLYKMNELTAVLLGTVTGVGGGVIRDVLLSQVPSVLRAEVYATAALLGSIVLVVCRRLRVHPTACAMAGAAACFLLRVVSVWQHWNVPRAR